MQLTLAILMVLGIYVGIPIVLVLAIGGVYALGHSLARRAQPRKAAETTGEVLAQPEPYENVLDRDLEVEHI